MISLLPIMFPRATELGDDSCALVRGPFITDLNRNAISIEDFVEAVAAQIGSNFNLEKGVQSVVT